MSELFDEEPMIGVSSDSTKTKRLYYNGEIYVAELERLEKEIKRLQEEHRLLAINSVNEKVKPPKGWQAMVVKTYATTIQYQVYRDYYEERRPEAPKPTAAPSAPRQPKLTRLERMLQVVDSKTLFNSGLLSKEEKKSLLDDHLAKKEEAA